MEVGRYAANVVLKDKVGTVRSESLSFVCSPSSDRGFVGIGERDSRFMEFANSEEFFAIGQNLAFISGGQYVNLTKAEEIFGKLIDNGANFLRVWTCCEDWAMAIEAQKSGWGRSWSKSWPIAEEAGRKYVQIKGESGRSLNFNPCYPVGVKPGTRYALVGRFLARVADALTIQLSHGQAKVKFDAANTGKWRDFNYEFPTGSNSMWLGRLAFGVVGDGDILLDELSLIEAGGGAELLTEADVNRSERGHYNQLDCFILDQVVELAELNDIYLILCLITRDLCIKTLSKIGSAEYEQAIEDARKFMRYAVARWGYSTSVAVWEYFNEMDPGKPAGPFYDRIGEYLEQIDPYKHLRTTSTWYPSAKDCRHGRIDIAQEHHYKPLSTFLEDVRFSGLGPVEIDVSYGSVRLLGYQGGDCAYFWLSDPQATWHRQVIEKKTPAEVENLRLRVIR